MSMLHSDLTRTIIGCAFDVLNELGPGFLESVYEKAMAIAISESGVPVRTQAPIEVMFRGQPVGEFYADDQLPECHRRASRTSDEFRTA